jgi:plastocyanin
MTFYSYLRFATVLFAMTSMRDVGPGSPTTHPSASGKSVVTIDNFAYSPRQLKIEAGTRVTWVNHDDVPHTVSSSDKRFVSSGALDTDDTYSVSFDSPGTYTYFCAVHPHMTGSVIVTPQRRKS